MSLSTRQSLCLVAVLSVAAGCGGSQTLPAAKPQGPTALASKDATAVTPAGKTAVPPDGEAAAIAIARRAVEANDKWAEKAKYEPKRDGDGWSVMVWRVEGYDKQGRPLIPPGAHRLVRIDKNGNVTAYMIGE
ncbi:MAG: hypothetical protein NTW87_17440 [Planctomycetota bacterium]|nr:hypothetical protein [Planctomycetota bacterium]